MGESARRGRAVGIAGGSGSGKTTITAALMQALGDRGVLLQHDWYYRDQAHVPVDRRVLVNYDHPDAQETSLLIAHIDALKAGRAVVVPQYDFTLHTRGLRTVRLAPAELIVVEGINTLADAELRGHFDLTVFIDAPADIRFIRRLQRDMIERGRTMESVTQQYLEQVRPMYDTYVGPCRARADLVLSGEAAVADSVARILDRLKLQL